MDLPKQSLVQISRVSDLQEQEALLVSALSSDTPFKAAKQERSGRNPKTRLVQYKRTFSVEGFPGSVTVALEQHPDEVTSDYLVRFLAAVSRFVIEEEQHEQ